MRRNVLNTLLAKVSAAESEEPCPCPVCTALAAREPDFVIEDELGETRFYAMDPGSQAPYI